MAKKTALEALSADIGKILAEYGEEVAESVDEITKAMAQKGVKALRSSSKSTFRGTGKYASGWTSEVESSRTGPRATIYNKHPGLPHLLENGHAKRGGGRVPGRAHIAPVEDELVKAFEEEVASKL